MSRNRSQVRTRIREELKDFSQLDTVDTGGIDASATTLPVSNVTLHRIGDLLQIESEILLVDSLSVDDETLTVTRAYKESTAAAHVAGVAIRIIQEASDRMINQAIDVAIADTYVNRSEGDAGIWYEVTSTSLTTDTDTREYTIPSPITFVNIVEVEDDNGNFQISTRFRIVGTKLVFTADFATAGQTIRLTGMAYQAQLTDDSTAFTLSDETVDRFIVPHAALGILEMRLGPRLKATEYAASVNDRAGQPNEMIAMMSHLRRRVAMAKTNESRPMKSGYMLRASR